MIPNLPIYISISFILATIYTIFAFIKSNHLKKTTLPILIIWSLFISVLAFFGFYHYKAGDKISTFIFVLLPAAIFITYLIRNKTFYQNRDFRWSTAVHFVRLPIELLLFQLAIREWLPMEMTYKGWNFDIIPGVTSIILVIWMQYGTVNKKLLLGWNVLGLIFILFILTNGFLSQELIYKNFNYSVPNRGIAYFPMILLAGIIVPIVIYTHISDIILLSKKQSK
ncbi:hypothetical protein H9I45_03895 [Polaribacter haliotis]|uniref:Uncharacterized protein n=1 Tax=Polaribacter haliotis TaxID=1888915 RepID=A0A7L8AHX1_9FLAO|nr:hypothetical protein [Polaribacter haliotis]QOD61602.1 hypothetical protein H9I45_03895 [Polaribacter haliotis]